MAFSRSVKNEIKIRSNGQCEDCSRKSPKSIASHINHDPTLPEYGQKTNGRHRCHICEARHHIKYAFEPDIVGLSSSNAIIAAWSNYRNLEPKERKTLGEEFLSAIELIKEVNGANRRQDLDALSVIRQARLVFVSRPKL